MLLRIIKDIGDVAQWGIVFLIPLFIVQYSLLAKWWKNAVGRTIVLLDVCLLAALVPSIFLMIDPDEARRYFTTHVDDYVGTAIVVVVFGVVLTRIWMWERIRRRRHHNGLPDRR
jgi:hypothetical protein